jgi:putative ABC transport system substrate-binding protein
VIYGIFADYFTFGGTMASRGSKDEFRRSCLLIAAIGPLAVAGMSAAQTIAQVPRVAILDPGSRDSPAVCPAGFRQGLRELGYIEGKNIVLEIRYANGQPERVPVLAAELVRMNPNLIWTHGTDLGRIKQVTTTIPVVFGVSADVVERGIVASLRKPGGNFTGIELRHSELVTKRLELLKAAVPTATRIALLLTGAERIPAPQAKELGVQLQTVIAGGAGDFEAAFTSMRLGAAEALLVSDAATFAMHRQRLLDLALKHRLPTMSGGPHFAEAGSLLSYGADVRAACQRSAALVDKIVKGADPATLPVEQVDRFQFVVNLKTAKKMGIVIPQSVLLRADRVIE